MLVFPKEYPHQPPSILMITPSGRFEVNTRLCLSMSDFHPETWNPSWGVETILVGLLSFMLDKTEPATTGGLHTSNARRRALAQQSRAHNAKNKEFCEIFPEFAEAEADAPAPDGEELKAQEDAEPPAPLIPDHFRAFLAAGVAIAAMTIALTLARSPA
jgi:hypothetical protein